MGETTNPADGMNETILQVASKTANWTVLPNSRLGLALPVHRTGRQTYLAADGKSRLCIHGEKKSRIAMMTRGVRKRGLCNCKNLDGLASRAETPVGWKPPRYFDVLVAIGMEEVHLPGGRVGRHIPYSMSLHGCDLVMLPCGNIRCIHGHSESTLKARHRLLRKGDAVDISARMLKMKICHCNIKEGGWRRCSYQNVKSKHSREMARV